ncbi:hypothetical protein [Marinobacter sp. CHS3-4]|uniref:hypothetical protein n=1 Tax=Marinobacter sp. CHS3-4 TaxID=3045174 RepID=UPI0024B53585|nr:hypothetical protein [Marinobacter sp. CHS3-4]MDI9246942.1 hypothetical protein [Marinobacter sp. CHS3-4]
MSKKNIIRIFSVFFTIFSSSSYFWLGSDSESRLMNFMLYVVVPLMGLYEAIRYSQGKSVGIGLAVALENEQDKRVVILVVAHLMMATPLMVSV